MTLIAYLSGLLWIALLCWIGDMPLGFTLALGTIYAGWFEERARPKLRGMLE